MARCRLLRLGLVLGEGNVCHVCREDKEVIYYLFVQCSRIYRLWVKVAKLWGSNFVGACDVGISFDIWCYAILKDLRDLVWRMVFMALAWSIWRMRNRVIIRDETFDERYVLSYDNSM